MKLDRATALQLLPCYVCEDLPADATQALEDLLAQDPDLAGRLHLLRSVRELHADRLLKQAPELTGRADALEPALPSVRRVPPRSPWGLAVGFAAATMLTVSAAVTPPEPAGDTLARLHSSVAGDDALLLRAESPVALVAMLRDAGVSPQLAIVHDLSAMGFSLVGVRILGPPGVGAHPGVAIVYEKNGQRFVCQIQLAAPTSVAPDKTATAEGVVLRAYTGDSGAVVSWNQGGRWCLFGGPADTDALLAMVQMRMTSS